MIKKKVHLNIIIYALVIAAAAAMLLFPDIASQGAYYGIVNSLEILIPSLFPFMVLTLFLTESSLSERILKFPSLLLSKLCGIDKKYCSVFMLGMIGGYPAAAKNIATLCKKGAISHKTSEILLCFCTNAGPSFLISAVGSKMFLSDSVGAILFISSLLSSFSLIFVYGKKLNSATALSPSTTANPPLSTSLVNAVKGSCSALTTICSFVIIFSVFIAFVPSFSQNFSLAKALFYGIFEVTTASAYAACELSLLNVLLASAICGWGGLCVMLQICAICSESGISIHRFILSRFLNAILNVLYTFLLLIAIPINTTQTFISNTASAVPAVFSAPIPALMLLLCCVTFPICLKKEKTYKFFKK